VLTGFYLFCRMDRNWIINLRQ